MDELSLLAPIGFMLIALLAGAALKLLLAKINIPYTVGLFVVGMIIGTMSLHGAFSHTPLLQESIVAACNIDPDLILNIFLPILIFSAAYELDIHIFRKTLTNSTLLAVPGLIIAMILTAVLMMGVTALAPAYSGWNWSYALMFGALISATDPVAVVALLGELSISKRFSTLIDGESLLNDGTGIVLFMLIYAPFTASVTTSSQSPVMSFMVVVFGGLAIGYLCARLFIYFTTRIAVKGDMMLQTSTMILLSYLTFILAQDIFELSGVIALVAFGLVVAYHGVDKIDERTREFMKEFWGLLAYIANTLIFIIIGVIIAEKVSFTWSDLLVLLAVYIGINVVRALMIVVLYPLLKRSGYGLTKREGVILSWGALRGALGLTLALMVSYTESIPEDVRRQVLLLTAGIVALTLIINATTMKKLLTKLGMLKTTPTRELMKINVRKAIYSRNMEFLEQLKSGDTQGVNWAEVEQIMPQVPGELDDELTDKDLQASIRLQLLSYQRATVWFLYKSGVIAIDAQRKLIDILDQMVDSDGYKAFDEWLEELTITTKPGNKILMSNRLLRYITNYIYFKSPIIHYEVAYGAMVANYRLKESLNNILSRTSRSSVEPDEFQLVNSEISAAIKACEEFIADFARTMPKEYNEAQTQRAKRMVARHERETIHELVNEGMIDAEAAQELL